MIAPELLQEIQQEQEQDDLIESTNEIEPKPQSLPTNSIISEKNSYSIPQNNLNPNKINKNFVQSSLIPEVSESLENTESISINPCSSTNSKINNLQKKTKKKINNNQSSINEIDEKEEILQMLNL